MSKKFKYILIVIFILSVILVGCTESYKASAIPTDLSGTVSSNGGSVVKYNDYVYFINGYGGATAENIFGDAQKGAIYRAKLKSDGSVDKTSSVCIVPKNIYHTDKKLGFFIVNNYIYYSTPSVKKDSTGAYKTADMVLMRTKIDGTDTTVIKEFEGYTATFYVTENSVLYYDKNELHSINLSAKAKFEDTKIAEEIASLLFPSMSNAQSAAYKNYVFFVKANADENVSSNLIYSYKAGDAEANVLIDGNDDSVHVNGFTLSLVDTMYNVDENSMTLLFNKTDSGANKLSEGTYLYNFKDTFAYDKTKEVRLSDGFTYTSLTKISADHYFANTGSRIDLLTYDAATGTYALAPDSQSTVNINESVIFNKAVTILRTNIIDNKVIFTYVDGGKVYSMQIYKITDNGYVFDKISPIALLSTSYNSTWIDIEMIGDNLFFFNSAVKDNMYVINVTNVLNREDENQTLDKIEASLRPTLIGVMTDADELACM